MRTNKPTGGLTHAEERAYVVAGIRMRIAALQAELARLIVALHRRGAVDAPDPAVATALELTTPPPQSKGLPTSSEARSAKMREYWQSAEGQRKKANTPAAPLPKPKRHVTEKQRKALARNAAKGRAAIAARVAEKRAAEAANNGNGVRH